MKADVFEYEGEGIQCVYDNKKWVVCIKNWKPNNDIEKIQYLEVHHATDEQFILVQGKAVLLTASRENDAFKIDHTEGYKADICAGCGDDNRKQRIL